VKIWSLFFSIFNLAASISGISFKMICPSNSRLEIEVENPLRLRILAALLQAAIT
jgi:hypothetical protein